MRIAIFEDEKIAAQKLQNILNRINPSIEIVATITSIAEGRQFFAQQNNLDLVLLDVHLEDGLSFKLLEENLIDVPVIFTTAYDRYALDAFKFHSIDYLLKPIQKEELERAIYKHKKLTGDPIKPTSFSLNNTSSSQQFKERFTVKYGDRIRLIPIEEIGCFYSRAKGNFLFTSCGKSYLLEQTLDSIYALLDPKLYFKVNRKHIIRMDAIDSVIQYSNSRKRILLKTEMDEEIIVAREKVKEFTIWLG